MDYSEEEYERLDLEKNFLENQKALCEKSKNFKLHFAFESLRLVLDEAEEMLFPIDLNWIWGTLYEQLENKGKTASENYIIGLFIHALMLEGAKRTPAIEVTSDWVGRSPTKCRTAYDEIKDLAKMKEGRFWLDFDRIGKKTLVSFIENNRTKRGEFPRHHKLISAAFDKLIKKLNEDAAQNANTPIGFMNTTNQYQSNNGTLKAKIISPDKSDLPNFKN